jgi:hypothetical protein
MARSSRSGPGYVGLTIFIVLCLLLIIGYIPVVQEVAKRGDALDRLHGDIKTNLEDGVPGLGVRAQGRASKSDVAYDAAFFSKIAEAGKKGMKYDDLLVVTGFGGDNSVEQINSLLTKTTPPQANLQAYIQDQAKQLAELQSRLNVANTSLQKANAERDKAVRLQQEESQRLKEANAKAADQLAGARREFNAIIEQTKQLMNRAVENAETAWGENSAQATRFKQEMQALQEELQRRAQRILELQEELQRKKPQPPKVTEGQIIQVDLMEEFAIINLGAREDIRTDDVFVVMRLGRAGERIPKAELKVTVVEDLISRADITQQTLEDPIVRGDLVVRQIRPEEM